MGETAQLDADLTEELLKVSESPRGGPHGRRRGVAKAQNRRGSGPMRKIVLAAICCGVSDFGSPLSSLVSGLSTHSVEAGSGARR